MLLGRRCDPTLERIVAHLGGYGVPISIVSFEVFEPDGGPRLLIREVEEQSAPTPARRGRKRTVAADPSSGPSKRGSRSRSSTAS